MLLRFGMVLVIGLVLGARSTADDKLGETLLSQEKKLLDAVKRKDQKTVTEMLAHEAYSINPAQGRLTGAEQVKLLAKLTLTDYGLSDVKTVAVSKDVGILTYIYTWKDGAGRQTSGYATSVWALRDGQWRSIFYQETPKAK